MLLEKNNIKGQGIVYLLLAIIFVIVLMAFRFLPSLIYILAGFLALVFFAIAFFRTDFALFILLFSMLLSPEFGGGGGGGGRAVVLRLDDVFLFIVLLGWFARMALYKHQELALLRRTPLNAPIFTYFLICVIATLIGSLRGFVRFERSIFYLIKYFEYYLIFFLVTNTLRERQRIKFFIYTMLFVALIISLYAWFLRLSGVERVTAPFEGKTGEPNTLGGYLLLMLTLTISLFLNAAKTMKEKIFLGSLLALGFPAFLFTLSRASWLGFIPAFFTLTLLTPRGKFILFISGIIVVMFATVIFPEFAIKRIQKSFERERYSREFRTFGRRFAIDESASARVANWEMALNRLAKEPFIGYGSGYKTIIDNQYARVLMETGLIGFAAFMWIIITIFRYAVSTMKKLRDDEFACGLSVGFISGLTGLLMHAFAAESFILIRIMEPFWFLTAIVINLPDITASSIFPEYQQQDIGT